MLMFSRVDPACFLFSIYTLLFGNLNYSYALNYTSMDGFQIYILSCELFPYVWIFTQHLYFSVPETPEWQYVQYWTHHSTRRLLLFLCALFHLCPIWPTWRPGNHSWPLLLPYYPHPPQTSNCSARSVRTSLGHYCLLPIPLRSCTSWPPGIQYETLPPYLLYTLAGEISSNIQK